MTNTCGCENNEHCLSCSLKYCEPSCFDKHEGSMIALGKLVNFMADKKGKKVFISVSEKDKQI